MTSRAQYIQSKNDPLPCNIIMQCVKLILFFMLLPNHICAIYHNYINPTCIPTLFSWNNVPIKRTRVSKCSQYSKKKKTWCPTKRIKFQISACRINFWPKLRCTCQWGKKSPRLAHRWVPNFNISSSTPTQTVQSDKSAMFASFVEPPFTWWTLKTTLRVVPMSPACPSRELNHSAPKKAQVRETWIVSPSISAHELLSDTYPNDRVLKINKTNNPDKSATFVESRFFPSPLMQRGPLAIFATFPHRSPETRQQTNTVGHYGHFIIL